MMRYITCENRCRYSGERTIQVPTRRFKLIKSSNRPTQMLCSSTRNTRSSEFTRTLPSKVLPRRVRRGAGSAERH